MIGIEEDALVKKLLIAGLGLLVVGCADTPSSSSDAFKADQQKRIGMPNPASAYCVEKGGRLEIRQSPDGDTGYCHLPDGRVIEEWELFRADRKDAAPE